MVKVMWLLLLLPLRASGELYLSYSSRTPRQTHTVRDYEFVLGFKSAGSNVLHYERERENGKRFSIWRVKLKQKLWGFGLEGGLQRNTARGVYDRYLDVMALWGKLGVGLSFHHFPLERKFASMLKADFSYRRKLGNVDWFWKEGLGAEVEFGTSYATNFGNRHIGRVEGMLRLRLNKILGVAFLLRFENHSGKSWNQEKVMITIGQ